MNKSSSDLFEMSLEEAIKSDIEEISEQRFSFLNGFVSCLYLEKLISHAEEVVFRKRLNEGRKLRALIFMDGSIGRIEARINEAVNPIYP